MSQFNIDKFDDFIGNTHAVNILKTLVKDSRENNIAFPHIGIFGPHGHGKSNLAWITANELGRNWVYINSTGVKSPLLLRGLITHPSNMQKGAVIFLDECHQLTRKIQDSLLSALEKPAMLVTDFKGTLVQDNIPDHITFIFATTNKSFMRTTLLSRLEEIELYEYSIAEKQAIAVKALIKVFGLKAEQLDVDSIMEIARIARSGREVIKICGATIRTMRLKKQEKLSKSIIDEICEIRQLDQNGLTNMDRKFLRYLHENGQVGVDNLAAFLNIPKKQIQENIEPFLIRNRLIVRQASGRVITQRGYDAMQGKRIKYE